MAGHDEDLLQWPSEGNVSTAVHDLGGFSMPLLDHFHPPLQGRRHWEGFHGRWAAALADALNETLPQEYFAEFQVTLGTRVEVDVATFTEAGAPAANGPDG